VAASGDRAGRRDAVRGALREAGLPLDVRAETLSPEEFVRLADSLEGH
jgi:16S rRNA A1518/A1519 N6-dimethyltransferase RsmA/KsgA/DIM1 with predicted DNA glycosylase/AP lyase activity